MATVAPPAPPPPPADPEYTFTVEQYHRMIEAGILSEDAPVELIDGVLVPKMTRKPPHDSTLDRFEDVLRALLPPDWRLRAQKAIALRGGEPEPDVAVVLGPASRYDDHHPTPAEIALLGEVADASLGTDRGRKYRAYARAGIPVYWIVNLIDAQIEVYSDPESPPGANPRYQTHADYRPGQSVPVVVAGTTVGSVPVDSVLPRP
jgi:Uma2 family endonuclease